MKRGESRATRKRSHAEALVLIASDVLTGATRCYQVLLGQQRDAVGGRDVPDLSSILRDELAVGADGGGVLGLSATGRPLLARARGEGEQEFHKRLLVLGVALELKDGAA